MSDETQQLLIQQMKNWVLNTVVGLNFCPFARKPLEDDAINYCVVGSSKKQAVLEMLLQQCVLLEEDQNIATSLIILDLGFADFYAYLEVLDLALALLSAEGYDGVYQLASFHPEYCFDGLEFDDAANFTNRAPFPVLHLIREQELTDLLLVYPQPEKIPERNIQFAREKGVVFLQNLLNQSKQV
ncbi:MAG: DUF1415 domain-containing protein [Pseudomonadales bacterium]|nr:DUF1415 domain-containing protein [Pseudomonadales bacterium]